MVQSITQREEVALELQGARARLAKVLHELELYRGRHDHDDHEYTWLLIELDESSKALMRAREKVDQL